MNAMIFDLTVDRLTDLTLNQHCCLIVFRFFQQWCNNQCRRPCNNIAIPLCLRPVFCWTNLLRLIIRNTLRSLPRASSAAVPIVKILITGKLITVFERHAVVVLFSAFSYRNRSKLIGSQLKTAFLHVLSVQFMCKTNFKTISHKSRDALLCCLIKTKWPYFHMKEKVHATMQLCELL